MVANLEAKMISTVSGLPAIVIDKFRELDSRINHENKNQVLNRKEDKADSGSKIKVLTQKLSEEKSVKESQDAKAEKVADYSKLADKLRSLLGDNNFSIEFSMDKETKKMVMKVIDNRTQEVIKVCPPDITLNIARIVSSTFDTGNVTNATV